MTKRTLTDNQILMIELSLYYEDYEMRKMMDESVDMVLANSMSSTYIKEYYLNLINRLKLELKDLLDCISYDEVYERTVKVYKTYDIIKNTISKEEMGFVGISEIENEESKVLIEKINSRKNELYDDIKELIEFYNSL